ncbi:hypothetical protein FS837_012719 [Tulasnella sp. UAMH 9824]|nr:hypothetical protein FS837_012719 [Tulasnella sp. UAMH 9824]
MAGGPDYTAATIQQSSSIDDTAELEDFGPSKKIPSVDLYGESTGRFSIPRDDAVGHPAGDQEVTQVVSEKHNRGGDEDYGSVSQEGGGMTESQGSTAANRPPDHGMTEPQCLNSAAIVSADPTEHVTPTNTEYPGGNFLSQVDEVSGLRSPCRSRGVQNQDPFTSQMPNDLSRGSLRHVSTRDVCPCSQEIGHTRASCFSQTASQDGPPVERDTVRETSYPPRHRDPTDALVRAMQGNSRRLDDLERGVVIPEEATWMGVRDPRTAFILTVMALAVMLLEGGTKLYGAIHPPPTR